MEIPIGLGVKPLAQSKSSTNTLEQVDPASYFASGYQAGTISDIQQQVAEQFGFDKEIKNLNDRQDAEIIGLQMKRNQILKDPNISDDQKAVAFSSLQKIAAQKVLFLRSETEKKQKELASISKNLFDKQQAENEKLKIVADYMLKQQDYNFKTSQQDFENKLKIRDDTRKNMELDMKQRDFNNKLQSSGSYDFSSLDVGGNFGKWKVSQTYGTNSVLKSDNVPLKNGQVGTPGIDLVGSEGDPIPSFVGGKVVKVVSGKSNIPQSEWSKTGGSYGNQVIVEDANGNQHIFNHLSGTNVKVGDTVSPGQAIASMGNSGTSTGTHLDYRVKDKDGNWDDPRPYLNSLAPKKQMSPDELNKSLDVQQKLADQGFSDQEIKKYLGDKYVGKSESETPGLQNIVEGKASINKLDGVKLKDENVPDSDKQKTIKEYVKSKIETMSSKTRARSEQRLELLKELKTIEKDNNTFWDAKWVDYLQNVIKKLESSSDEALTFLGQ